MKFFIFLIGLLLALESVGQQKKDSITVNDSWQKKDISKTESTLKDSLRNDSEMKIITRSTTTSQTQHEIIIHRDSSNLENRFNPSELLIMGKKGYRKSHPGNKDKRFRPFSGHWCGFYYGFVNFANTDYSMYPAEMGEFMELDWANSSAMQFNIYEHSINLVPRNNFGLIVGFGVEYQRLRFSDKHTSVNKDENDVIVPVELDPLGITHVKRNSFKTLYLTIPLLMEYQFPASSNKKLYISGGVMGGVRLHSKTKVVYNDTEGEKHKRKNSDNFNMVPFKADLLAKIGYRCINVWGSYTLTNMFKADKGPELHPYTIGLGIGF